MAMRGLGAWALVGLISATTPLAGPAASADEDNTVPALTADQIVERNVAARGGLNAWRKIRTMVWSGHIAIGDSSAPTNPFVLEYKRPNKTRFEIRAEHEKTLRVFDGARGWKMHTGGLDVLSLKPYTAAELRSAHDAQGLDGLLIDHQAKGIKVALEGPDVVEGRKAYRLTVPLPFGATHHVWIDAQTFLELKYDRKSHAAGGRTVSMVVFYRNFRAIDGLQMPMTIEAETDTGRVIEKMTIDDVTLNPSLSDAHFEKPNVSQPPNTRPDSRSAASRNECRPLTPGESPVLAANKGNCGVPRLLSCLS